MKLETYLKNHFQDVTVIGVVNPSIILNHEGTSYVIYRLYHGKQRFVLCKGEQRFEFDTPSEIHKLINQKNEKIQRKGNIPAKR